MVVVFSGSETSKLEEVFASLPVWLAAENGVYVSPPSLRPQSVAFAVAAAAGAPGAGGAGRGTGAGCLAGAGAAASVGAGSRAAQWVAQFDTLNREWMEAVQLVLDYFCERTPRSFVEVRETSLVWNYKYAGPKAMLPSGSLNERAQMAMRCWQVHTMHITARYAMLYSCILPLPC